jgi:Txe/YoeB family toxin of Txe-Axe toxin-antitoxin module
MRLEFKAQAFEDFQYWVQVNPKTAKKVLWLIEETRQNPFGARESPSRSKVN